MNFDRLRLTCGPFAQSENDAVTFCHNLFLSQAISECTRRLTQAQIEYEEALLHKDDMVAEQKRQEVEIYRSSLQLTAHMFDEVDKIST